MVGRQSNSAIVYVEPSAESFAFERRMRFELALIDSFHGETKVGKMATLPIERIEKKIILIRNEKVLLDADLAELYDVETKALNKAVSRNLDRFPEDFMFRLTGEEFESLRSQFGTSNPRGGRRYAPYAFTEQGVAMLSSVLRSERAVAVNVQIMRTFVRLRQMLASNASLARKLHELEQKYDRQFKIVFDAIRELMVPPLEAKKPPIGFLTESKRSVALRMR